MGLNRQWFVQVSRIRKIPLISSRQSNQRPQFEYDGPQLFEARGDDGSQYLALLVGSEEGQDSYLVVRVDPDVLNKLRTGALELRSLIALAGRYQWYLANSTNLDEPLAIEPQKAPIDERFLPDEGFMLADSPSDKGVVLPLSLIHI